LQQQCEGCHLVTGGSTAPDLLQPAGVLPILAPCRGGAGGGFTSSANQLGCTALFTHKISILIQKRYPYTGNLNSERPGDSKNVFLHWGDVLGVPGLSVVIHSINGLSCLSVCLQEMTCGGHICGCRRLGAELTIVLCFSGRFAQVATFSVFRESSSNTWLRCNASAWLPARKCLTCFKLQLALMILFSAQGHGRQNKPRHNAYKNVADAPTYNS